MRLRRNLLITGLYVMMLLIAVGVVFYSNQWYRHQLAMVQQPVIAPVDDPLAMTELPPLPPLEQYVDMVERPLFMSTRRPPEPAPEAVPEAVQETPPVSLAGAAVPIPPVMTLQAVMMTPQSQIALVTGPRGRPLRLQKGSMVEDWQVTTIEPQQIILQHGTHQHRVPLRIYERVQKKVVNPQDETPPTTPEIPASSQKPDISFGLAPNRS